MQQKRPFDSIIINVAKLSNLKYVYIKNDKKIFAIAAIQEKPEKINLLYPDQATFS